MSSSSHLCNFSSRETLINPQRKSKKIICFTFILWLLFTSIYSPFVLGLKQKAFNLLVNSSVLTDVQEFFFFQKERGGVRRTTGRKQLFQHINFCK